MLSRRDTTLLLFALGFAAFFIGIWFLPALPGVSYKKLFPWLILIWTVGSIITFQGCLVCLLSRVELRTALPVIAVHSALVFVDANLVFVILLSGATFSIILPCIPQIPSWPSWVCRSHFCTLWPGCRACHFIVPAHPNGICGNISSFSVTHWDRQFSSE